MEAKTQVQMEDNYLVVYVASKSMQPSMSAWKKHIGSINIYILASITLMYIKAKTQDISRLKILTLWFRF